MHREKGGKRPQSQTDDQKKPDNVRDNLGPRQLNSRCLAFIHPGHEPLYDSSAHREAGVGREMGVGSRAREGPFHPLLSHRLPEAETCGTTQILVVHAVLRSSIPVTNDTLPQLCTLRGRGVARKVGVEGRVQSRTNSGHIKLNAHLFHKLKICPSEMCPCDTAPSDNRTLSSALPSLHVGLRGDTWPENRHLREKLLGDFAELKKTAAFVRTTWVDV